MKVLLIFGTRPEAIKMAPVIKELRKYPKYFKVKICVTAQHRKMLDQVLNTFRIIPDYDLNIMAKEQDLFDVTVNSLTNLKNILKHEKPDLIIVQGDTTTTFAAGLSAYFLRLPIAHIEAGLRTYDKYSPFPEEKNRHMLSVVTDYHFAATEWAKSNLLREGVPENRIWVTGNTVIDALYYVVKKQKEIGYKRYLKRYFEQKWNISVPLDKDERKLILVTGHRRESFGKGFKNICLAIKEITEKRRDIFMVYPVHLNPNVQKPVKNILGGQANIHLIKPLSYEHFIFLMSSSYLILTDSGGIQEEAPSLGKPVLVMRNTTERPEGIEAGIAKMVGTDTQRIVKTTLQLLDSKQEYLNMSKAVNPYGDGKASQRIVKIILKK